MGLEAEDLLVDAPSLTEADLEQYRYPHDAELASVGVRGIYLNNFRRWDSKAQHEQMIARYGYETFPQQRTFDTYNDVDSFHYSGLHDVIKYRKWGYGKVTDHASREIRLKRMTREEGIATVSRYASVVPADLPLFLEWIGMSETELWGLVDVFRDPKVWRLDKGDEWVVRDSVAYHVDDPGVDSVRLPSTAESRFVQLHSRTEEAEGGYVLIGRGWVDNAAVGRTSGPS
jgi:hypothetical protein